jgi:hypothetical protein
VEAAAGGSAGAKIEPAVAPGEAKSSAVAAAGRPEGVDCTGISREECRDLTEMEALGRLAEREGETRVSKERIAANGTLHKEIRQSSQAVLQGVEIRTATDGTGGETAVAVVR